MQAVHLVACASRKRAAPCAAADLYVSDWFVRARTFVEAMGGPWFILSARHGLLRPSKLVEPYDLALSHLTAGERRRWADRVLAQLDQAIGPDRAPIVFLAGWLYREHLEPWAGNRAQVPMRGLGLGRQKAWLVANTPCGRGAAASRPESPSAPAHSAPPATTLRPLTLAPTWPEGEAGRGRG